MSRIYRLESIQKIPGSKADIWKYFTDPQNLFSITPPSLNLKMTGDSTADQIHVGQTISYIVKPLFGIPLKWITEIKELDPEKMFVDEQIKGPYALWRHQHHFTETDGGVKMTDMVDYRLPFGFAGNVAHSLVVKKKLEQIFDYRYQVVNKLFGNWPGQKLQLKIT
jgi:ligand-binding SRPBCC domain-containing protein